MIDRTLALSQCFRETVMDAGQLDGISLKAAADWKSVHRTGQTEDGRPRCCPEADFYQSATPRVPEVSGEAPFVEFDGSDRQRCCSQSRVHDGENWSTTATAHESSLFWRVSRPTAR